MRGRGRLAAPVPPGNTGPGSPACHPGSAPEPGPQPSQRHNAPVLRTRRSITCRPQSAGLLRPSSHARYPYPGITQFRPAPTDRPRFMRHFHDRERICPGTGDKILRDHEVPALEPCQEVTPASAGSFPPRYGRFMGERVIVRTCNFRITGIMRTGSNPGEKETHDASRRGGSRQVIVRRVLTVSMPHRAGSRRAATSVRPPHPGTSVTRGYLGNSGAAEILGTQPSAAAAGTGETAWDPRPSCTQTAAGPGHRSCRHPVGPGPLPRRRAASGTRRAGLRLAGRMGIPDQLASPSALPDYRLSA
jgi:hypothetical protein